MKNMPPPCISVIIPVYNTAPYLRQCLDSVCGQTYPHLEIICVDDGSTDGSSDILAEYAARDSRVIVITQPNGGLSAARNAGLSAATGEYVTGVDSDDYLEPDAYELVVNRIGERLVDIVCYGISVDDEIKSSQEPLRFWMPDGYYPGDKVTLETCNLSFCNKLWRRDFLVSLDIEFPVGLLFEDRFFWDMAAPYAKSFLFYSQCRYHYVQREGSIMHTFDYEASCINRIKGIEAVFHFQKKRGGLKNNFLSALVREYENVLDMAPRKAKSLVRQSFRHLFLNLGLDKEAGLQNAYPIADLTSPWRRWNPFYRRSSYGITLKFFCLPIFWVKRKELYNRQETVYRYMLFGIRIAKKTVSMVKG